MGKEAARPRGSFRRRVGVLLRPHWKSLSLAFVAVLGETVADVLQPWPLKIVLDSVVQSKRLPPWLERIATTVFAGDKYRRAERRSSPPWR